MKKVRTPTGLVHWVITASILTLMASGAHAWDFTVSTNGNQIDVYIYGMHSNYQTCAGAALDDPTLGGAHCSQPGSYSESVTLACNRVGTHTVYAYVADDSTGGGYEKRSATVVVSVPPPVYCPAYEIYARSSRALTHKYGDEAWPTGQHQDGQVEVVFKPVQVDAGTMIHAKVFDPKDASFYRTNAAPGDNLDTAAGKLAFSPSDSGTKSLSFIAGDQPLTTIYLNTTTWAAGDNYSVRAGVNANLLTDPNFVCTRVNGCVETLPVTAWKRVYLEKHQMFRRGVFIRGLVQAGSTQLQVQVPGGLSWSNVALRPGDAIRLLHAPRLDGDDMWTGFYWEDAVVANVDSIPGQKTRRLITLAGPLVHSYNEDTSYLDAIADGVSDGVGYLTAGTYERNEWYLPTAFNPAYVQFWPLDQGVSEIPYLPVVSRLYRVANKWFENTWVNRTTLARPGNSNVKHALTGSGEPDGSSVRVSPNAFGKTGIELTPTPSPTTGYIPEPNFSWTWVGGIERAVSLRGGAFRGVDPWIFNGENLVHELAHTFNVNSQFYSGTDFAHCGRVMASNPALNCRMRSLIDPLYRPAEVGDGVVGFHYSSDDDSEYMTIRKAWEPLATPLR